MHGGTLAASEGVLINGPLHASGGAIIGGPPVRIFGDVHLEEGARIYNLQHIHSGETRLGPGGLIPYEVVPVRLQQSGRLVLETGATFGPVIGLSDNASLRIEPGATGPANIDGLGSPNLRLELVIDAAQSPPFVARPLSNWGPIDLAGTLVIKVVNPNALRVGDEITLLTSAAPLSGSFAQVITPALHGERVLQVITEPNRVLARIVPGGNTCWTADTNGDGDSATDADIEAFFECLAGNCCNTCAPADFNSDGFTTDADIESFFRVLAGGPC